MSFTEQIAAVVEEVERQGGALLPDPHKSRELIYIMPPKKRKVKAETCGCYDDVETETLIVAPYDPSDNKLEAKKMRGNGAGFATACIVCDRVDEWPRFKGALED